MGVSKILGIIFLSLFHDFPHCCLMGLYSQNSNSGVWTDTWNSREQSIEIIREEFINMPLFCSSNLD